MPDLWPECATAEDFERVRRDEPRLLPGVRAICAAAGQGGATITRFADGSLPVYAIGERLVLKLYPPVYVHERHTEAAVLDAVAGKLAVPTPAIVDNGALEGWGYLLMTRLSGLPLAAHWGDIPADQRVALARALGASLAVLHKLPAPDNPAIRIDWPAFVAKQRRTALDRQRERGVEGHWLRQIPDFLASVSLAPQGRADDMNDSADALLHTEIMREHLLVERRGDSWQLSGLFDFEPSMRGAAEYEFASVGLFFSCGSADLLGHVLLAYGYGPDQLDGELARRFLAYALLHKYSDLGWYLRRLPDGHGVATLDQLADYWWGARALIT